MDDKAQGRVMNEHDLKVLERLVSEYNKSLSHQGALDLIATIRSRDMLIAGLDAELLDLDEKAQSWRRRAVEAEKQNAQMLEMKP